MGEIRKAMKEAYQKEKAIQDERHRQYKEKQASMSETDKMAKTANTVMKGALLWWALPGLTVIAVLGLFFVVWLLSLVGIM